MIDLRRLHMLRLVHQYGTVTSAADALHLTPSAVSHQLRELARELKVPLLEPQGRKVRLTPAAHLLVEHADGLLAKWEETLADLESHRAGAAGPLRMCGFTTAVGGLVAPAAGALLRDDPDLAVEIRECDTDVAMGLLAAGETDIAVIEPTPRRRRPATRASTGSRCWRRRSTSSSRPGIRSRPAAASGWRTPRASPGSASSPRGAPTTSRSWPTAPPPGSRPASPTTPPPGR